MLYGVVFDGNMPWFTGARWKTVGGARRHARKQLQLRQGYTAEVWYCPEWRGLALGAIVEEVKA